MIYIRCNQKKKKIVKVIFYVFKESLSVKVKLSV